MRFDDDPLDILISGKAKLWMLLVGVNEYQDKRLNPLNFAVSDCQGLAEALEEATQRFRDKEVIIHCNPAVQRSSILEAVRASLRRIVTEANPQDTVLFYFSGHGVIEPVSQQPFLCLAQTQIDNLHHTGLGLQELLQQLQLCGGKQLVLLDACHSGSIVSLWGGAKGDAVETQANPTRELAEVLQQHAAQSRGFCALLSCDEGQRSWEFPDLKHGVFTYYLMQGLLGEATDTKGVIEAKGLYRYVYDQTQRYVDARIGQLHLPNPQNYQQNPRVIMSMAGDLVLGLRPEGVDFLKDYEKRLLEYRQKFNMAIQREYPLSQDTRQQLQWLQQESGLRDEDIISTEGRIIAVYEPKLKRYEQEINALIHQQYPLNQDTHQQLQQLQQELGLSHKIITSIEARVATVYVQKLQQYEAAFTRAIQRQYPLRDDEREVLSNFRRVLHLRESITDSIEAEVTETYNFKPTSPISEPQRGEDKKGIRRLLLKAIVAAALVSMGSAYYAHIKWQDNQSAKAVWESTKIIEAGKECTQNLLNECQSLVRDEKWLAQAKALAKNHSFKDAIATANKIQPDSSFRASAQLLISQWSVNLFKQAEARYKQSYNSKDLKNTIAITQAIPKTSVTKNLEKAVEKWRTEWNNNENYLHAAQNALKQGKWQEAIDKTHQVRLLGQEVKQDTPYWLHQMKPIIEIAQKHIVASKNYKSVTNDAAKPESPPTNLPPAPSPPVWSQPKPPVWSQPRSPVWSQPKPPVWSQPRSPVWSQPKPPVRSQPGSPTWGIKRL